jgi:hypothetical protein
LDKNIELKMDNSKSTKSNYKVCTSKKYYIIEGDDVETKTEDFEYDFFNKLKCMTQCNESIENVNIDSCCLLTKEALNDIHVTLNCGHKFNYIPLYKEVVIQKTSAGMTTNGYYNSCTLRLNEMKCPYCRRVQDKLLPFLNYDDVKRLRGVNGPESLCMKARMCENIETNQKSKKKNSKKETSSACECNATHVVNGAYYCKKHYDQEKQEKQEKQEQEQSGSAAVVILTTVSEDICGVVIKTGKKKGLPCTSSSKCRIHAHLRKGTNIVVAVASPQID